MVPSFNKVVAHKAHMHCYNTVFVVSGGRCSGITQEEGKLEMSSLTQSL
jgi:hypothetical protein